MFDIKDMLRLVQRPIEVTTKDEFPYTIIDGDNTYIVNHIIDWWMEAEAGARGDDEPPRTMYRVQTQEWFLFDLSSAAVSGRFIGCGIEHSVNQYSVEPTFIFVKTSQETSFFASVVVLQLLLLWLPVIHGVFA